MKMQSKMLENQARKTDQEIKQLTKKISFVLHSIINYLQEISRGNQEGARIYCDVPSFKNQLL